MKEPVLSNGEMQIIGAHNFKNGIYSACFKLGMDFNISKSESTASLKLITKKAIYYEASDGMNILIVKEGGKVPYFTQIETWGPSSFINNELKAVMDLRAIGLIGAEFKPEKINDGRGAYGADYKMIITPEYFIYFNKQNAQEEIKNRLNKIKNKDIPNFGKDILDRLKKDNERTTISKEEYKQFTLEGYKSKSKENQLLASISDAIKSEYSSDVKIIMVRDIIKRYDRN